MNAGDMKIGKVVYHKKTGKKGIISRKEKYKFNLCTRIVIKWDDGTETGEQTQHLRFTLNSIECVKKETQVKEKKKKKKKKNHLADSDFNILETFNVE
jgi:hypothetical protein